MIKKLKVKKYVGTNKKVQEEVVNRISIRKSLTTFQIYLKRRHKSEGTMEDYNRDLLQFLSFLINQLNTKVMYVDQITKAELIQYEDYLLDKNLDGEIKTKTVIRKIMTLRAYYKFLNRTYQIPNLMIDENITKDLKTDKKISEDVCFTDRELIKLFEYIETLTGEKGYRDRAMIYFLYYTGCRRSEMLRIKWSDINMIDKTVRIYRPKNHTSSRLDLDEKAFNEIISYSRICNFKSDYVFPKPSDIKSPFDGNTFYDRYKKILEDAGIAREGLSPHSMRHTFVTKQKLAGTSDDTIIDYTGHTKVTGLQPYTHIKRKQKYKVHEALKLDNVA